MSDALAPVRSCCMTRHFGPVCPDNTFMCCLCFEKVSTADAYEDDEGRWDMCKPCGKQNNRAVEGGTP